MVYLIHFEKPFKHAKHYIGFTTTRMSKRLKAHRNGTGSRLLRALNMAGIGYEVVRVWKDGDRNFERQLKNRKKASQLCPCCTEGLSKFKYRSRKPKAKAV